MSRWPLSRSARTRRVWGADLHEIAWQTADALELAGHGDAADRALADGAAAGRVDAIAGNDLAVHWLQPPPAATRSLAELKLVAAARCAHLYGGTSSDWLVTGDWSARRPFVCAALPRAITQPLQQACAARGARLHWHSAWAVLCAAHARSFPEDGWSGMRTPERIVLWHCNAGHVDALNSIAVAPDTPASEVEALVQLQMRLEGAAAGSGEPGPVHWAQAATAAPSGREAMAALALAPVLQGAAA